MSRWLFFVAVCFASAANAQSVPLIPYESVANAVRLPQNMLSKTLKCAVEQLGELIIGADPLQIETLTQKLRTAGASAGPGGILTLAISAIDMPAGAVVMEVESGRPIAKAGIHAGDVVLSIGSRKITSEDDLRQAIFKIGPGKTEYSYRRGSDTHTAAVDCPSCKAE